MQYFRQLDKNTFQKTKPPASVQLANKMYLPLKLTFCSLIAQHSPLSITAGTDYLFFKCVFRLSCLPPTHFSSEKIGNKLKDTFQSSLRTNTKYSLF